MRHDDKFDPGVRELLRVPAFVVHRFDLARAARRRIFLPAGLSGSEIQAHSQDDGTKGDEADPANFSRWN